MELMKPQKKVYQVCIILFLSFNILTGLLIFARGFLLNRSILPTKAEPCDTLLTFHFDQNVTTTQHSNGVPHFKRWCNKNPAAKFSKTILLLVDAFRYDFVERMPYLKSVVRTKGSRKGLKRQAKDEKTGLYSCVFKFRADPPTTTMQRLKAIATGTMSTFLDASANFNSYEVEEDSLIHQFNETGKRIAFLGDDTWLNLFPPAYFTSPFVEGHPSFDAWDLDTVDRAVNRSLRHVLEPANRSQWDILIAHLLGVDHCGHRYGPNHPEMKRKLLETDNVIRHVLDTIDNETLLVIFGDHGMTNSGDHGGDSEIETDAALVLLTKDTTKLKCPTGPDGDVKVSQVDLVPTLSALNGVPIPYSNIGSLIFGVLPEVAELEATTANLAQISAYLSHYTGRSAVLDDKSEIFAGNDKLSQLFNEVNKAFIKMRESNFVDRARFFETSKIYFAEVRSFAETTWTQFNVPLMYGGAFIVFLSILCLTVYVLTGPVFSIGTAGKKKGRDQSLPWVWLGIAEIVIVMICFVNVDSSVKVLVISFVSVLGMSAFLAKLVKKLRKKIVVTKPRNNSGSTTYVRQDKNEDGGRVHKYLRIIWRIPIGHIAGWETLPMVLYLFTCFAVFSNSFVINEGYVLGYAAVAVVFFHLLCSRRPLATLGLPSSTSSKDVCYIFSLPVVQKHYRCSWVSFLCFVSIARIGYVFFRCREELTWCEEPMLLHKQSASLPSDWIVQKFTRFAIELVVFGFFIVFFRQWLMLRQVSASLRASAVVAKFVPIVLLVILSADRGIRGLVSTSIKPIEPIMDYFPKLFNIVAIGSFCLLWLKPLCCVGRCRPHKKILSALLCSRTYGFKADDAVGAHTGENGFKNGDIVPPLNLFGNFNHGKDNLSEDVFTSVLLTAGTLLIVTLAQTTSEGMSPSLILIMLAVFCLIGIFRSSPSQNLDSWTSIISWTLASQYFFYATGHQTVFSTIPWDSAFTSSANSTLGSEPSSLLAWVTPAMFVLGNLHSSHIVFAMLLPLLVYWKADKDRPETLMGDVERRNTLMLYAKFMALHGLKLFACMLCAAWQRRHLMVWKIFAPKLIFEAVSFIMLCVLVPAGILFFMRIDYAFRSYVSEEGQRLKTP